MFSHPRSLKVDAINFNGYTLANTVPLERLQAARRRLKRERGSAASLNTTTRRRVAYLVKSGVSGGGRWRRPYAWRGEGAVGAFLRVRQRTRNLRKLGR